MTWTVSGGDMYQFQSSIDGGGSFSVNRAYLGARLQYRFSPSLRIGFKLNTEIDSYDFKGGGSFADAAGGTPWTTTQEFSIGGSAEWKIDDRWTIFGSGSARWAGEPDADWGSSFSTGGVIAGSYTFSRDLTLGAGLLASGRLDGSVLFIPSLLIDWTITDRLVVTNVRGPATYPPQRVRMVPPIRRRDAAAGPMRRPEDPPERNWSGRAASSEEGARGGKNAWAATVGMWRRRIPARAPSDAL